MKLLIETLNYNYDAPIGITHTATIGIVVPDEYRRTIPLKFELHHRTIDDKWIFAEYTDFDKPVIVEVTQDRDNVKIKTKAYTWILFPIGNRVVCTEISNNGQVEASEIVTLDVSELKSEDQSITIETLEMAIGTIQECLDLQHKLMLDEPDPYIMKQHQEVIDALTEKKESFEMTINSFNFLLKCKK